MTKAEIIAELRSMAESEHGWPSRDLETPAWLQLIEYKPDGNRYVGDMSLITQRTYCLLVACALEDEC